jgi:AcrR family transcriptional regulator
VSSLYHHGSLREVLVAEGRRQLMEEGSEAITIRGLAKRAGVSHSAPLRHFRDREALLDEIAAEGSPPPSVPRSATTTSVTG